MTRPRLIWLRQRALPAGEKWSGGTDAGARVHAFERNGRIRIEVNGRVIIRKAGDDAYAALAEMFDIACEPR